jgi:tetratricopeptide (TPR) repeat protein
MREVRAGVAANERLVLVEGRVAGSAPVPNVARRARADTSAADRDRIRAFWAAFREATAQRIAGRTTDAAQTYARALALDPVHEDALYYGGSMRLELGDFDGAAAYWRRLLAANPSSARTHSQLGALFQCLDRGAPFQLDSAEWHSRRAHELNKEETGPLVRLGEIALMRGDVASARRYFAAVLATHPGNTAAHFYSGYLRLLERDRAGAREELRRARASAPVAVVAGASNEGDTKRGGTPLQRATACNQLRTLYEQPVDPDAQDTAAAFSRLDALLAQARARAR